MKTYIGFSNDENIRYSASSGGVGTSMVKYLLEKGGFDYALTFEYNSELIEYSPKLVSSFQDYNICGSIYNEIKIVNLVKKLIEGKNGKKIVFFCLPCQTKAIRKICEDSQIKSFIIGLTCSSQQGSEATDYLLSCYNINREDISFLRYRGNGWPSGIQIRKRNGEEVFVSNNGSLWTMIFHSRLFIQPRCYKCSDTLNTHSDMVLADPWLDEYNAEKIGKTLFACYSQQAEAFVKDAINNNYISADFIESEKLEASQEFTIKRKEAYKRHPRVCNLLKKVFYSKRYRKLVTSTPLFFRTHCYLTRLVERIIEYY